MISLAFKGLIVSGVYSAGSIIIDRFRAVRNGGSGISIGKDGSPGVASLIIRDSILESNNPDGHEWRGVQESELHFLSLLPSFDPSITRFGGVWIDNLSVVLSHQHGNKSSWLTTVGDGVMTRVSGNVTVHSAIGCPLLPPNFGAGATDIHVSVACVPT